MRKALSVLAITTMVIGLTSTAALAQNPHFLRTSASVGNTGNLTATFKVAGLGDNETILVTLSADATAQYVCFNGGGNHPQAANKETVSGPVSASGEFTSGKNGSVTGSLTVSPPSQGDFSCPNGQRLALTFVSYTNVSLTADTAEGTISADIPGTFTFGAPI
jgi:hypothetical protein